MSMHRFVPSVAEFEKTIPKDATVYIQQKQLMLSLLWCWCVYKQNVVEIGCAHKSVYERYQNTV